jgi:putative pyruvate formate lyase activating enzyme
MSCNICPRECAIDRENSKGFCKANNKIKINLYKAHFGEEPIISGNYGSGTIFFSYCNLKCVFCQNYLISDLGYGNYYSIEELSNIMLELQNQKVHNINLVTPTHYADLIIKAIVNAKSKGLNIPILWNTNGYEKIETLKKLEGLIDIYLPDFKYFDNKYSNKYSIVNNYPEITKMAILEMYRQVGNMNINKGIANKGIMIRLLLLPNNINSIEKTLKWIYENIGNEVFISLMSQYYPMHKAHMFPEINRPISKSEYNYALEMLYKFGFENGFVQDFGADDKYIPKFKSDFITK